jgi:prophage regulatory protein
MATQIFTKPPPSVRFLKLPQVKIKVAYGRTAIYEKIKKGEFPQPYALSAGGRAVAWRSDEIDAWIDSRMQSTRREGRHDD